MKWFLVIVVTNVGLFQIPFNTKEQCLAAHEAVLEDSGWGANSTAPDKNKEFVPDSKMIDSSKIDKIYCDPDVPDD